MGKVARANRLVAFLLEVVTARDADGEERLSGPRFAKVLAHISRHLVDPEAHNVASLAQIAELSVSRFKTSFKAEMGVPPAEYVLRARIEAARRLTGPGATLTDVALNLGFSSSQYFASAFKRLTHSNPSRFKR